MSVNPTTHLRAAAVSCPCPARGTPVLTVYVENSECRVVILLLRLVVLFCTKLARQAKNNHFSRRKGNGVIGLRIASFARLLVIGLKLAKTADQQSMILLDRLLHDGQQCFHCILHIGAVPICFLSKWLPQYQLLSMLCSCVLLLKLFCAPLKKGEIQVGKGKPSARSIANALCESGGLG